MQYPFDKNIEPEIERLFCENFPEPFKGINTLFPHIIHHNEAYHVGFSVDKWNLGIRDLIIYCKEAKLTKLTCYWTYTCKVEYLLDQISSWIDLYPKPQNWNYSVINDNCIGVHLAISSGILKTLTSVAPILPYQIFMSNPQSFALPVIQPQNNGLQEVIKTSEMRVFAHLPYIINLVNPGIHKTIRKHLEIATAYGFSGCVIHVAKNTKKNSFTYEEAANNMYNNIVNAMSPELCPLLVETCSNQGTEIFFRFYELVHFALQVQKLHPSFGICIDTCHVFNSDVGYDPHYYLKYCLKNGVNVRLIHFNDSRTALGRHIDRHALAGTGHIPWTMLDETAKLATLYNIPCIVE